MAEYSTAYLLEKAKIIFARITKTGIVMETNRFYRELTGEEEPSHISTLIPDMMDDESILMRFRDPNPKMITVNGHSRLPQSFLFTFLAHNEDLLIFGEYDFDEIRNLQKELIDLNNEFSALTRQLYKQNSELSNLGKMKDQFLSIAAHDLRNPLGNIISIGILLEYELKGMLNKEQASFLKAIQNLGEFGLQLLNDLLDHSTISSGKLKIRHRKTNPIRIIRENIELNRFIADKRKIELIYTGPSRIEPVYTDKAALQQVLNNLLSNAIKYSPDGERVEIGLEKGEEFHTFSVKDHGPGIAEHEISLLFEAFGTTSSQPHGEEKSTGLGLWIVKKLMESLSGTISVESTPGEGTRFVFGLPVYKTEKK